MKNVSKIQEISNIPKLKKNYQLNMPQGVKGRSSNNDMAIKVLNWKYKISLYCRLTIFDSSIRHIVTKCIDKLNKF